MPYYRGVEKDALIDSIEHARAFLGKLNMGPGAQRAVDVMLGPNRTGMLELADTNQELHYAVNETNLSMVIGMLARVLKFHAVTDPSPGPGQKSEAQKVYAELASWGAFLPKQFQVTSTIDKEFDSYLLPAYAKAVADQDEEPGSPAQERLNEYIDNIRRKLSDEKGYEHIAQWLDESVPLITSLSKIGADAEVTQILKGNPGGAALLPGAFEAMFDIDQRIEDLQIENPVGSYRVSLGTMPVDDKDQEDIYRPVLQEIQSLMIPFILRDEMLTTMLVVANPQNREGGVMLFGTREAMEYLSEHLPEDMPLYDPKGQRVVPPSEGWTPPRGPAPGPGPS